MRRGKWTGEKLRGIWYVGITFPREKINFGNIINRELSKIFTLFVIKIGFKFSTCKI